MNTYVVWIEIDRARIFKIIPDGATVKTLRRREIHHHISRDPENRKQCDKFFKSVSKSIDDADEILLMGPSLTKNHFKTYLDNHNEILGHCIVGVMTLDHEENDAQLIAHSGDFFKKYDTFSQPITA